MSVLLKPRARPVWSMLAGTRPGSRYYATEPIKNPNPPKPIEPSSDQAQPLGAYYESILDNPTPYPEEKPEEPPSSSNPEAPPEIKKPSKVRNRKPKAEAQTVAKAVQDALTPSSPLRTEERAQIIFGSSLAGPAKRAQHQEELQARSKLIAGILVPPKPEEPDNCCMSGCVNCVWDTYREDMEAWSMANAEAQRKLKSEHRGTDSGGVGMDDDGGGSETTWAVESTNATKDLWNEELYKNLPVGIREFMRQEKRLKEKHLREGTTGG